MRGEWVIRARSRTGGTISVHYGTQAEIEMHARAARSRGDEIEEQRLLTPPEERTGKEREDG